MPKARRTTTAPTPKTPPAQSQVVIDDVIDLTQDSPVIVSRTRSTRNSNPIDISEPAPKRSRKSKPDDTIVIDDTNDNADDSGPKVMDNSTDSRVLTCPICFDALKSEKQPWSTFCGHLYCKECLLAIIKERKRCALCQKSIQLKQCHRLHL